MDYGHQVVVAMLVPVVVGSVAVAAIWLGCAVGDWLRARKG